MAKGEIMSGNIMLVPLVILLTFQAAWSTEPEAPVGRAFNPDSFRILSLLRDELILKSLDLSDAQRQSLGDMENAWAKEFNAFERLNADEREKERVNLDAKMRDFEKQALALLSDQQCKQLEQIERRRRWRTLGPMSRLDRTALQDELRLTDAQRAAIRRLLDEWIDECEQLYQASAASGPAPSAGELGVKLSPKYEQRRDDLIRDSLSNQQRERLAQIELQMNMSIASAKELARPELAAKLKLTPEQRKRVDAILQQHAEQQRAARAKALPGERPKLQFLFLSGLEVLTAEQKQELRKLIGKPFGFGARLEQALSDDSEPGTENPARTPGSSADMGGPVK
jgi:Spy/CpxP family protein refolding chaperone